jgi:general secretion pathway protein A
VAGYLSHFGLKVQPFSTSPDPRFAYATREHEIAATKIQYAVEERQGLFLLMGEIGTGKTTLAQFMLANWRSDPQILAGHVTDPAPETPAPFLRLILGALGQPTYYRVEENKLALRQFLIEQYQAGRTVVVLIDEAQSISSKNMDTLQTLANEQTTTAKLLQIVLLALPNFARKLTYKPALRSRIASGATLDPLTFDDAVGMLRHRADVAGGDFDALFPAPLHRPLYNATRGNPRNLCVLCDNALVNAYARRRTAVDEESLAAALTDLNFKGWSSK